MADGGNLLAIIDDLLAVIEKQEKVIEDLVKKSWDFLGKFFENFLEEFGCVDLLNKKTPTNFSNPIPPWSHFQEVNFPGGLLFTLFTLPTSVLPIYLCGTHKPSLMLKIVHF